MFHESSIRLFASPKHSEHWLLRYFKACRDLGLATRPVIRSYSSLWQPIRLVEPIVPALPAAIDIKYDEGNFLQKAALKSALSIVCIWYVLIEETTWYVDNFTKQLMIYKNAICSHSSWTAGVYYRIFAAEDLSLMSGTKLTLLSRPPASGRFFFQLSRTAYRHRSLRWHIFCVTVSIFAGSLGLVWFQWLSSTVP